MLEGTARKKFRKLTVIEIFLETFNYEEKDFHIKKLEFKLNLIFHSISL